MINPITQMSKVSSADERKTTLVQFVKFSIIGTANTLIDIAVFNLLLWFHPTQSLLMLVVWNAIAVLVGSCHSFFWNKYWTFRRVQRISWHEVSRFALLTGVTIGLNSIFIFLLKNISPLSPTSAGPTALLFKILVIAGTALLSFSVMHLFIFAKRTSEGR